jgi:hypothetical protein
MQEAEAAWIAAKEAAERRFSDARDAAVGAWMTALQQVQMCAAGQLACAQQRWKEVCAPSVVHLRGC